MIAITKDAAWTARLRALAARGGWTLSVSPAAPAPGALSAAERALVIVDRAAAGAAPARAVAVLRGLFPAARVCLACTDGELGADGATLGVSSGADELLSKSWPDERVFARLAALRDAALAAEVRVSSDGALKAEKRSHRAFARVRGRWVDLPMAAAEFALLYALLGEEGTPLSRERLLAQLRAAAGREVEPETVSRRVLSLRRALKPWKGAVESVRGGFYRLVPAGR